MRLGIFEILLVCQRSEFRLEIEGHPVCLSRHTLNFANLK